MLAGGCVELSAAGLPYAPFTAALRQLARDRGTAGVAALLGGRDTGELAALLPEFGAPPAGADPDMARARLFELLLAVLEALADRQPLVLIVEDVHWADHPTRDLLSFLVRNLRHAAVLLVVTFRSAELHATDPLRPLLAGLSRMAGVTRVELPRLSRGQVEAQLEGILGRPPEPAVTNAVYQRGGGIPLFTEALVSAGGTVSPGVPWSLRDQLLGVVKELPEQTQQVLRAATLGGARVGHVLLAAVTRLDDAALAAALRPAVAASVMVADPGGYYFRHDLIRQAVQEDLLPGERVRAERAFAQTLEADPALSGDGMAQVRLALHWRNAHEHERALRAAWAAAAGAAARFAFAEQMQMLEQVLQLWDRVPSAAEHTGTDRAGMTGLAADAARLAGAPERGLTLVETALGDLGESGDPGRRASLLLRRAVLRQQALIPGPVDDLQTALRLARSPDRVRAEILGQLSRALSLRGRDEEAKRAAEELTALGRRNTANPAPISQKQRLDLLQRLLTDEAIALLTRAAAVLMLLYAQPLTRILRLTIDDVLNQDGEVKIRLGEPPAPVPEPFASLLLRHTGQRLNLTTATNADARWLFPGRRGGQPMDPASIEKRLHLAGIPARNGRTAALRQLVLQAPAPVIAEMLSYSHQGTARVAAEAGSPWSRYASGDNGRPSSGKGDS